MGLVLSYALIKRPRDTTPQFWLGCIRALVLLKVSSLAAYCFGLWIPSFFLSVAGDLVMFLTFIDIGKWKKRWGKIKSAALTAVNQSSFRNQQKEAFS